MQALTLYTASNHLSTGFRLFEAGLIAPSRLSGLFLRSSRLKSFSQLSRGTVVVLYTVVTSLTKIGKITMHCQNFQKIRVQKVKVCASHCATIGIFFHLLLLHKSLYKTISRYFAGFSVFFGTLGYRGQGMINISSGFWAEGVENLS